MKVYDLDDDAEFREFAKRQHAAPEGPGTGPAMAYDPQKRIGVTISKLAPAEPSRSERTPSP